MLEKDRSILLEIKYCTEPRRRRINCIQCKGGRQTGLVTFCVETASVTGYWS